MKEILIGLGIAVTLSFAGCGHLAPGNEEYNEQKGKTVFRSADHGDADNPEATPIPEKVPGEELKPGRK